MSKMTPTPTSAAVRGMFESATRKHGTGDTMSVTTKGKPGKFKQTAPPQPCECDGAPGKW